MAKAKIIGTGFYVPGTSISNSEIVALTGTTFPMGTLEDKLGIYHRHAAKWRGIEETTTDFATQAARAAISNAGIDPMAVRLFIVGTDTPEYLSPGSAVVVQGRVQGQQMMTGCFDVNASCASFTTAFEVAARMMASDASLQYAVVIGAYNMPPFVRPDDSFGNAIFADGAGAIVLQRVEDSDPSGYIGGQLMSDGTQWDYIGIYAGGSKNPITHERLDKGEYGLQNLKPLPGDRNVKLWPVLARQLVEKCGRRIADIDHVIFTQINRSVILEVMNLLELPPEKTTMVMDRYGYTGSACVPMALHHAVAEGRIKRGDTVALIASGSGFFVGANLLIF